MSLKLFFDVILKGESKTYNDHNWYKTGKKLSGYIEGRNTVMYGGLKKPLSEYTIGEIKQFQAQSRGSANGQLWAVGRYQMIPESLKGQQKFSKIPDSAKFDKKTQDIIGESFLKARNKLWKYIKGEIPDTTTNLNAAIVDVAKTWSSVGVPYAMKGHHRMIEKDQSYYTGGGDRASVKSETVVQALKGLRNFYTGVGEVIEDVEEAIEETAKFGKKNWIPILIVLAGLSGLTYYLIKSKTIKLK